MKKSKYDPTKDIICQVCLTPDPPDKIKPKNKQTETERKKVLQLYQCITCKNYVHKYCYDPSLHDPKTFKCDGCKHSPKGKQNKKSTCYICKNQGSILKYVEQNKFAHVTCLLGSQTTVLQNFKTLRFKISNQYRARQIKEIDKKQGSNLREKHSRQISNDRSAKCLLCNKPQSSQSIYRCHKDKCDVYAHINCIQQNKILSISNGEDILFNLLNQTQGSFRVRNSQFIRKNGASLKGMDLLQRSTKNISMITCSAHCSEVVWCTSCSEIGDPNLMVQCSRCLRWTHEACTKMKNKSQDSYLQCNACMHNHKFLQGWLFPQLINSMVQIQTSSSKWTSENIKMIDSFTFKSSLEIYSQILNKNREQFEYYHLYNYLEKDFLGSFFKQDTVEKALTKIDNKLVTRTLQKFKIIEILYYLKYRQIKKTGQFALPAEINELRSVYPIKSTKKSAQKLIYEEKCKRILDKFLDVYLKNIKQADLRDISGKFIQFSDKIRKQIFNLKQNDFANDFTQPLNKLQNLKNMGKIIKRKPMQIALDLRQLLKMVSNHKDRLKGKLQLEQQSPDQDPNSHSQNNQKSSKNQKNKPIHYNNFLMTLIKCITAKDEGFDSQFIEEDDLLDLINSYRKVLYIARLSNARPPKKLALSEEEFFKIMNKSYDYKKTRLSEESRIKISKFFKALIKDFKLKETHQVKNQLSERYDQLIEEDRLNYRNNLIMRENIANQGLFVDKTSKIMNLEKRAIYYKVLKIKYLKIINIQLSPDNQSFPLKVNEKNRKDIVENVKRLLEANNKSILLSQKEKNTLEYFLVKQQVFGSILKEQITLGSKLEAFSSLKWNQNPIQTQNKQIKGQTEQQLNSQVNDKKQIKKLSNGSLTTLQRIKRIFNYWMNTQLENPYHIIKTIYPIAQKKIKFPLEFQAAFNDLIESIGTRYDLFFSSSDHMMGYSYSGNHRINSDEFTKLWKLIEYASMQNAFEKLKHLSIEYNEWRHDLENRYNPIAKVLQDKFLNSQLLQVIDKKIAQAERFEIDLKTQVKKLKIVKLWVVLSQKFQKDFQRKPTINAIQQFKTLMIKINYPHNQIFQKVIDLQIYGRQLNQRIQKYLKKQKQEDLEFYEELNIINSKMTLKQAEQLKLQLQNSKLDVSAELQELQDEIANFNQIPSKLQPIFKKQNALQELLKVKAKILETPIRYDNMDGFCQLVHRVSFLKCENIQQQIGGKKQFFRLLHSSDLGAIKLIQKMPHLIKAYRDIEKAEKQVLSNRPKFEHMLPLDGKKIRNELANDPTTLQSIQKAYQKVEALREKFKNYKNIRVEYDKYVALEYELSHYPITYKDIALQIQKLKRDLDILLDRAKPILQRSTNFVLQETVFSSKQAVQIIKAYSRQGIKHEKLQELKRLNENYLICLSFSERQEDYVEFVHKCKEHPQLNMMPSLNSTRHQLFTQYFLEMVDQKQMQQSSHRQSLLTLQTLMHQGSFLLTNHIPQNKHHNSEREQMIQKLLRLNKKIMDLTSNTGAGAKDKKSKKKYSDSNEEDQSNSDELGDDDQQLSEDYDKYEEDQFEDENDLDQQEQEEDQDEDQYDEDDQDEIPNPPKKRSQPCVLEISDEDQIPPVPSPKKLTHLNPVEEAGQEPRAQTVQPTPIITQNQEGENINQAQKQ